MLTIIIPETEYYDEIKNEFKVYKEQKLQLEHSLVSISKWESKFHKPFLGKDNKTNQELIYYIKCMTITQNVSDEVYNRLTYKNIDDITKYIDNSMTATTFSNVHNNPNREIITSELIYYWMFSYNIPIECQKWHINRLLTLIRVFNVKQAPPKKMSRREIMSRNAQLNAARRKKLNSKG